MAEVLQVLHLALETEQPVEAGQRLEMVPWVVMPSLYLVALEVFQELQPPPLALRLFIHLAALVAAVEVMRRVPPDKLEQTVLRPVVGVVVVAVLTMASTAEPEATAAMEP